MKSPQLKQTGPKPALKAKPKPSARASTPRPTAAKTARKKAAKPSPRKATLTKPARIPKPVSTDPPQSKQSQLIALLGSAAGSTMAQMMSLTGWQAHTVRGAISGTLRKRLGLNLQNQLEAGVRVYRLMERAA